MMSHLPYPVNPGTEFPTPDLVQLHSGGQQLPYNPAHPLPYPPQGASGIPDHQTYPGQPGCPAGVYPPMQAPYPPMQAPYPPQAAPYPAQVAPYPAQVAPYPSQGAPYPSQGAPYPSQGAPYPSQAAPSPYPSDTFSPGFSSQETVGHQEPLEGLFSKDSGVSRFLDKGLKGLKIAKEVIKGPKSQPTPEGINDHFGESSSAPRSSSRFDTMFGSKTNFNKVENFNQNQDYDRLRKECLRRGELFEDPAFPASNRLLTDNTGGQTFVISYFGRSRFVESEIEWLRPHEICQRSGLQPQMYVGERDRFDINQGEIGDCWFLAALANLAENETVVPPGQGFSRDYAGIFRFRFYRFGEWAEIVIDDRLPTRNGRLIYLRAKESNEFWSPLLEKAYAKLYGSYKALEGGLTIEAAVDFTGGIPEMIDLQRLKIQPELLFYNMVQADARQAFMSGSLSNSRYQREAEQKGLQARHAYTITKVVEVRTGNVNRSIPLIRLRNPHGNAKEWKGDWSDNDVYWRSIPKHVQRELGLDFSDDGEFYMNFNRDFLRYFGEVEIVHLTPTAMDTINTNRQFEVFHFHGMWIRGSTAGGCGNDTISNFARNPQFMFTLSDPDPYDDEQTCPVIISLAQKVRERKTEWAIGFRVYPCSPGATQVDSQHLMYNQPVGKTDQYINLREVSKRLRLPEGTYCIIPSTFNYGEEGEFLVRVFVEKKWGSSRDGTKHSVKDGYTPGAPTNSTDGRMPPSGTKFGGHSSGGGAGRIVPIMVEDGAGAEEHGKKRTRDKIFGFAMKQMERHYPKVADKIHKLRDYYSWCMDSQSELDLLKKIVSGTK